MATKRTMKKCLFCERDYYGLEASRFCSANCAAKHRHAKDLEAGIIRECEWCGTEFISIKYKGSYKTCCSKECKERCYKSSVIERNRPPYFKFKHPMEAWA